MKTSLVCTILLASVAFGAPTTVGTAHLVKRVALPGFPSASAELAAFAADIRAAASDEAPVSVPIPPARKSKAENAVQEYPLPSPTSYPPPSPTSYPPSSATSYPPSSATSYPPSSPTSSPNPTNPVGGVGGIDPNTGILMIPVTDPHYFCQETGQQYSEGGQYKEGSCSSTPQGQIPSVWRMVSTLILEPVYNAVIGLGESFDVVIDNRNLATGYFDNPDWEFYTQPQGLDADGIVQGHQHVTIQFLGDAYSAPEANEIEFFKGLNDVADEQGHLSVNVPAGTLMKPGLYRICSMAGSFAHQPVIMPVAKRGAQDDCIRIRVE